MVSEISWLPFSIITWPVVRQNITRGSVYWSKAALLMKTKKHDRKRERERVMEREREREVRYFLQYPQ
jgi:hypothetical protein